MARKLNIDEKLPFNKYMKKHPDLRIDHISAATGVGYFKIYRLMKGGMPTLLTAAAIEHYTKGEVKCADLIPKKKLKEWQDIKYRCLANAS